MTLSRNKGIILGLIYVIVTIFFSCITIAETFQQLVDDVYYFKFSVPASWNVKESGSSRILVE